MQEVVKLKVKTATERRSSDPIRTKYRSVRVLGPYKREVLTAPSSGRYPITERWSLMSQLREPHVQAYRSMPLADSSNPREA